MASTEDRAWRDYSDRFRRQVLGKILSSEIFASIGSGTDDFDVKQATEIGAGLLLDKPFVLLVPPGRNVSQRLRRAADVVLDDFDASDPSSQQRLTEALAGLGL